MPLRRCKLNGKPGWRWGNQKCYTGYGAKRKAQKQATAIYASGYTGNVFCPTGEGGGIDPTCSPGSAGKPSREYAATWLKQGFQLIGGAKDKTGRPLKLQVRDVLQSKFEGRDSVNVDVMQLAGSAANRNKLLKLALDHAFGGYTATAGVDPQVHAPFSWRDGVEIDREFADWLGIKSRRVVSEVSIAALTRSRRAGLATNTLVYPWEATPHLVMNAAGNNGRKGHAPNPLRADPSRTATLRRKFAAEVTRRFNALKHALVRLIVEEDAFGLNPISHDPFVDNVYCPTGEGGGVDPTCSPGSKDTPAQKRDEARRYWNDDVSFEALLSLTIAKAVPEYHDAKWSWLAKSQQRQVAEELLEKAISKSRNLSRQKRLLGLTENSPTANTRWRFHSTPQQIEAFRVWLAVQIKARLLGDEMRTDDDWWQKYVEEGYRKGAGRAFDDVKKPYAKGYGLAGAPTEDFYRGNREEFLRSSFAHPVSADKVKLLSGRVYSDLKGVTEAMSAKLTRSLTDGLVTGKSPREVARDIAADVDGIGRTRALVIARTETIRAHAEGQLDSLEKLGVEDVGVMVEWSTTGDDKVCEMCQPLDDVVLKIDEARNLLPRHPNCRCAWIPANVGEDTTGQVRTRTDIQQSLDESIRAELPTKTKRTLAEQKNLTSWGGADKTISKIRPESILNVYCPTGEGGGIDPTCSPGEGGGEEDIIQSWKSGGVLSQKVEYKEERSFGRVRRFYEAITAGGTNMRIKFVSSTTYRKPGGGRIRDPGNTRYRVAVEISMRDRVYRTVQEKVFIGEQRREQRDEYQAKVEERGREWLGQEVISWNY